MKTARLQLQRYTGTELQVQKRANEIGGIDSVCEFKEKKKKHKKKKNQNQNQKKKHLQDCESCSAARALHLRQADDPGFDSPDVPGSRSDDSGQSGSTGTVQIQSGRL
jgi:hypothetical protein